MISPYRVEYNTFSSLDFDLICDVAFDSDSGATSSFLSREAVASETYRGDRKHVSSYKYTESFAPVITFVDKNFGDFTMERQRQILKWITSKDTPSFLNVYYDDSEAVSYAILGNFISCDSYKLGNGRVVGFQCTFESVMPYALSDVYGRNSDNTPFVYNTTTPINTTMYYWTTTTVSGATAPQYVITNVREPNVGTRVYSVSRALTNTIIDVETTFYGEISTVNADGSYKINDTVFKLTYRSTKTQRTYGKISLDIDTDDNKPVYPKITINHGYKEDAVVTPHTIVPLLPHITFSSIVDMVDCVENTVYYNDVKNKYYWKTPEPQYLSSATRPNYEGWTTVNVVRAYTEDDEYANKTFYYYDGNKTYYWLDPYNFHAEDNPPGSFDKTSVKIINQHYDLFGRPSTPVVTIVKNNTSTEKIELDGANKIISSDRIKRVFGDDFNLQHVELYDGTNELTIEGNCEVTIEYRTVMKIGEY